MAVLTGQLEAGDRVPDDVLRKVALRFWSGEVVKGPLRSAPQRHSNGRTLERLTPQAPLIELLSEIRGLRGLRHRGQISAVEYERRRSQVLEKI